MKKSRKEPKEMSEGNLFVAAKIFWPEGEWIPQKKYKYDPGNKRKHYQTDCASEKLKTVLEYEGPPHYRDVWKGKKDEERKQFFIDMGYKFLRWPYYLQLTKDVAKHFFENSYSDEKYQKAIIDIYKTDRPELVLSPGLHESEHTPANFTSFGVRRFMKELDELPKSAKAQVAESLRRYINSVDDKYLVIGEQDSFEDLLKMSISKEELKVSYHYSPVDNG